MNRVSSGFHLGWKEQRFLGKDDQSESARGFEGAKAVEMPAL